MASNIKSVSTGAAVADIALNLGPIVYEEIAVETSKRDSQAVPQVVNPSNPFAGKGRLTQAGKRPPGR